MYDYQLCFLNGGGEPERLIVLQCRDDDDARHLAQSYARGIDMQLWKGNRLVERYPGGLAQPSYYLAE